MKPKVSQPKKKRSQHQWPVEMTPRNCWFITNNYFILELVILIALIILSVQFFFNNHKTQKSHHPLKQVGIKTSISYKLAAIAYTLFALARLHYFILIRYISAEKVNEALFFLSEQCLIVHWKHICFGLSSWHFIVAIVWRLMKIKNE